MHNPSWYSGYVLATSSLGIGTTAFNASGVRLAWRFVARRNEKLSSLAVSVFDRAGTGGTLRAELWASARDGLPTGSALESVEVSVGSTGRLAISVTGWNTTLERGKFYFIIIRNTDAAPGTNNFTLLRGLDGTAGLVWSSARDGEGALTSTDGGSTWTAHAGNINLQIQYQSSGWDERALFTLTNGNVATTSSPAIGFDVPSGQTWNVVGVVVMVAASTSGLIARLLDSGGQSLGTTEPIHPTATAIATLHFPEPIALSAGSYRCRFEHVDTGGSVSLVRSDVDTTVLPSWFASWRYLEGTSEISSRRLSLFLLKLNPTNPIEFSGGGGGGGIILPTHTVIT